MDIEKLGIFYLGKEVESKEPLLLDAHDLTTHAICIGMTGSGKTGLGIALLEEAALDQIPALLIDPKGDLGNLLLAFPQLSPKEFQPWIDPSEAERQGKTVDSYAQDVAKHWKKGLEEWGEGTERIRKLRQSAEFVIYTPGSMAGIPLSVLDSFAAPSPEEMLDAAFLRERISSTTSSLLGLIGIEADPLTSREHILLSTLIEQSWQKQQDLDIASLIHQIQKPALQQIGALDLETFFPYKERMNLAIRMNHLLASPSFQSWMAGAPLDIPQLLYSPEGKPKISIFSIAHLSQSERMFFVTLLLNQFLSWMRLQPGTSSLRALLYMDEIFGFFPPSSMPPSKIPMLTLLKQARAYGCGVILATQNPVDIDYKGLGNCGIWFIGKLQTDRDISRVIAGFNEASETADGKNSWKETIAALGKRVFLMKSIYRKEPLLFQTRWTMSYLRGPLTLPQIQSLMQDRKERQASDAPTKRKSSAAESARPSAPPGLEEFFLTNPRGSPASYHPMVIGFAKVHFVQAKAKIDLWQEVSVVAPPSQDNFSVGWEEGRVEKDLRSKLQKEPAAGASFEKLPPGLLRTENREKMQKSLGKWLYQNHRLALFSCPALRVTSQKIESESDFRARVSLILREERDGKVQKLRDQYQAKISDWMNRLRRAQERVAKEQAEASRQRQDTMISWGSTVLGAILGGTQGAISRAGTSMRREGKIAKKKQDVIYAREECLAIQKKLDELQDKLDEEIAAIQSSLDPERIQIETVELAPRKSDMAIQDIGLLWVPLDA